MGTFTYGQAAVTATFDDRMLAHLRAVITAKLRRSESFLFTWDSERNGGTAQVSVWMHPAVAISFDLDASATTPLNLDWLAVLAEAANPSSGLGPHREPHQYATKNALYSGL